MPHFGLKCCASTGQDIVESIIRFSFALEVFPIAQHEA